MDIEFSMDEKWIPAIEYGDKIATTRTKRKCEVADTFVLNGNRYVVTRIIPKPMWEAAFLYYAMEGFRSPDEMKDALRGYYPELQENDTVYVHFFTRIKGVGQ